MMQVGLHAWLNKRDEIGQTPLHCAVAGNNVRSIEVVRDKLAALGGGEYQVCINIPAESVVQSWAHGSPGGAGGGAGGPPSIQLVQWVEKGCGPAKKSAIHAGPGACRMRGRRGIFGGVAGRGFRPFILSLVAIATVCVCVCVVIRTPPSVRFVSQPFRWDVLESGKI